MTAKAEGVERRGAGLCSPPVPDQEELIARYIEPDPLDLGPAEAQIVGHGVAVWALIAHLRGVGGDRHQAAADYGLDPAAVAAAVAHYCRHRSLIDAKVTLNRSLLIAQP